jgi:hypothetical protein
MKRFIIIKESEVLLGRWKINTCQDKINITVDLSNEDHCGPCSFTQKNNNQTNQSKPTEDIKDKETINPAKTPLN